MFEKNVDLKVSLKHRDYLSFRINLFSKDDFNTDNTYSSKFIACSNLILELEITTIIGKKYKEIIDISLVTSEDLTSKYNDKKFIVGVKELYDIQRIDKKPS